MALHGALDDVRNGVVDDEVPHGYYTANNSIFGSMMNNYLFRWYATNNYNFRSGVMDNIIVVRDDTNNSFFGRYTVNSTIFNTSRGMYIKQVYSLN